MNKYYIGFLNGKSSICITGKLLSYIGINVSYGLVAFKENKIARHIFPPHNKIILSNKGFELLKSKTKVKIK